MTESGSRAVASGQSANATREKPGLGIGATRGSTSPGRSKGSRPDPIACARFEPIRPKLSFAQRVDEAIARARSRPDALSDRIESPATLTEDKVKALGLEDSEAWLEIDQAGLEEILRSREGGAGTLEEEGFSDSEDDASETEELAGVKSQEERDEERKNRRAAKQLEAMAGKVEDFVQGRGAVQGAVFDEYAQAFHVRLEWFELSLTLVPVVTLCR